MINSIEIKNFQSHKHTKLALDPGVNVILGPSDCGKTVIFRALNWLVNNRPGGNEFHSWAGGDPFVKIVTDDKKEITRTRIKGQNIYRLDKQEFKAFGTTVPEEIQAALNISDINFQFQLDDTFMFSQSPGAIAKQLNQVVDLEIIDRALFNINQRERKETNTLTQAEVKKAELLEEADKYAWLPEAEGCLVKLEHQSASIIGRRRQALALEILIKEIGHIEQEVDQISTGPIEAEQEIDDLITLNTSIDQALDTANFIDQLIHDIEKLEEQSLNYTELMKAEPALLKALKSDETISTRWNHRNKLETLSDRSGLLWDQVRKEEARLDNLEKEFHKLMPEECPLCGQEVK